jgi:hypothetical protein
VPTTRASPISRPMYAATGGRFAGRHRVRLNNYTLQRGWMDAACPYRKLKTADRDRESADTRCR